MAFSYLGSTNATFSTATGSWSTANSNSTTGVFLLAVLVSPTSGVTWAPQDGWQTLDGFATVMYSAGGGATQPNPVNLSMAVFWKVAEPTDPVTFTFTVSSSVGTATGGMLVAGWSGEAQFGPLRGYPTQSQLSVTSPLTAPSAFADSGDLFISVACFPATVASLIQPAGWTLRTSLLTPVGIAIADRNIVSSSNVSPGTWTGTGLVAPNLIESIVIQPEVGSFKTLDIYMSLTNQQGGFDYQYDQDVRVLEYDTGTTLRVWGAARNQVLNTLAGATASLFLQRPDGTYETLTLAVNPEGTYGTYVTTSAEFPYTGTYELQLFATMPNGAVRHSAQVYLNVYPSGPN